MCNPPFLTTSRCASHYHKVLPSGCAGCHKSVLPQNMPFLVPRLVSLLLPLCLSLCLSITYSNCCCCGDTFHAVICSPSLHKRQLHLKVTNVRSAKVLCMPCAGCKCSEYWHVNERHEVMACISYRGGLQQIAARQKRERHLEQE